MSSDVITPPPPPFPGIIVVWTSAVHTSTLFTRESIEWFIEGKAPSQSYDMAPRPLPPSARKLNRRHTHRKTDKKTTCWGETGGREWARSRILQRQESLVFYNHSILSIFPHLFLLLNLRLYHWKKDMVLSYFSSRRWEKEWNIEEYCMCNIVENLGTDPSKISLCFRGFWPVCPFSFPMCHIDLHVLSANWQNTSTLNDVGKRSTDLK